MEFLALLELCGCFVDGLTFMGMLADVLVWIRGQPNRTTRRDAAQSGETKPALDTWNWIFIILTPIVLLLGIFVVWKWIK